MKPGDHLGEFVRQALAQGHDRAALTRALAEAGWSRTEVSAALDVWADSPGLPPVPRPQPYVSGWEAVVYGLMFVSLAMVAWHVVQLGFTAFDRLIPDVGETWRGNDSIRWSVASLLAFLPLFLLLNWRVNRPEADSARRRSLVRKWFASVTLLIAALVLLGDLVFTVYALLNGDLTARFAAKAGLVALMGALIFAYYRDELDG